MADASNTHPSHGSTLKFPPSFIFNSKFLASTSYISTDQGNNLFAVDTGTKFNLLPRKHIVLHDGLDKSSPVIASAELEKGNRKTNCLISVAGLTEEKPFKITMTGDRMHCQHFTLPISGADEDFEWRYGKGNDIEQLSGQFDHGWKLIRLNDSRQEVVAVSAHPRWRKQAPFRFLGSGATGGLGEAFEVVAVISYLRLYALAVDTQNENAAVMAAIT